MAAILSSTRRNNYGGDDLKRVVFQGENLRFLQSADNCHNYARSTPP